MSVNFTKMEVNSKNVHVHESMSAHHLYRVNDKTSVYLCWSLTPRPAWGGVRLLVLSYAH